MITNFNANADILADVIMHNLLQEEDYMSRESKYFNKCSKFINNVSPEVLKNALHQDGVNTWRKLTDKLDENNILGTDNGAKKIITEVMAGTRKDGNIILPVAETIISNSNDSNPMKKKLQQFPAQANLGRLKVLLSDAEPEKLTKGFDEQLKQTRVVEEVNEGTRQIFLKPDVRSQAESCASRDFDWLRTDRFTDARNQRNKRSLSMIDVEWQLEDGKEVSRPEEVYQHSWEKFVKSEGLQQTSSGWKRILSSSINDSDEAVNHKQKKQCVQIR